VSATPEAKVKAKVKALLKASGAYYVMPVTGGYGSSGAPDFLVCHKGNFIGIECKAGKGVMTALQMKNSYDITNAGGAFFLITDDPATLRMLETWLKIGNDEEKEVPL
jgi:hypothetical protein